jgi:hypothetical protein
VGASFTVSTSKIQVMWCSKETQAPGPTRPRRRATVKLQVRRATVKGRCQGPQWHEVCDNFSFRFEEQGCGSVVQQRGPSASPSPRQSATVKLQVPVALHSAKGHRQGLLAGPPVARAPRLFSPKFDVQGSGSVAQRRGMSAGPSPRQRTTVNSMICKCKGPPSRATARAPDGKRSSASNQTGLNPRAHLQLTGGKHLWFLCCHIHHSGFYFAVATDFKFTFAMLPFATFATFTSLSGPLGFGQFFTFP